MTFPTSYRLLPYAWGEDARLWLVDLTFQRAPEVAAWWKTGVDRPMVGISSDGSRAVISAPSSAGTLALHLVDLRAGAATPLLEEDGVDLLWPTVDRSGQNVAYVRRPKTATAGRADDGIWITPIDRPGPRRIVLGGATVGLVERGSLACLHAGSLQRARRSLERAPCERRRLAARGHRAFRRT